MVRYQENNKWLALVRPAKKIRQGISLYTKDNTVVATVHQELDFGYRTIQFEKKYSLKDIYSLGDIPLPPYIKRETEELDKDRYQTVFAHEEGAVAAPTAGLHFTDKLLECLKNKGIKIIFVTLHVGPGTFKPVKVADIREHHVDKEYYYLSYESFLALKEAQLNNNSIISVGTTTTRLLESLGDSYQEGIQASELYIYPPYKFRYVNGLITNFHLPKSSLLLLVASILGKKALMDMYKEAINLKYRFYSYGDAMFLMP